MQIEMEALWDVFNKSKAKYLHNASQISQPNSNLSQHLKQQSLIKNNPQQQSAIPDPQPMLLNINNIKERLSKLVQFVSFHRIDQSQIWHQAKKILISEFQKLLNQNYGYILSNAERQALFSLSKDKKSLRPKDFEPLNLWLSTNYSQNFECPSSISNLNTNKNINRQQKKKNFNSQRNTNQKYLLPFISSEQIQIDQHPQSKQKFQVQNIQVLQQEGFKRAQHYSKKKIQNKIESLKKDIKESMLQKKWDFIVMAGEINQWIQKLKKEAQQKSSQQALQDLFGHRFKVINKERVEIIQINLQNGDQKQIPHVVFIKKYNTLKKKMAKEENNKNNLKGTVLMVLEDNDKLNKNNLINRINQRDQELNFVLLQVMRMKSMFQWQNSILKEAKINC